MADSTAMTPTAISTHWLASLPPTRLSTPAISEIKGSQRDGLLKMRAQLATFTTDRGKPYTLVELPLPRPMKDDNGDPLPATYCNYLVTPSAILMPTYNQSDLDAEAAQILERVYARQVIGIDCRCACRAARIIALRYNADTPPAHQEHQYIRVVKRRLPYPLSISAYEVNT